MRSSNFEKNYLSFNHETEPRNSCKDVWKDILTYSSNLNGNWLLSKDVFYSSIVPTAEKNPAKFAEWMKKMVKKSGVRIKSRAEFLKAINYLSRHQGRSEQLGVRQALYHLFEAGLDESVYSYMALKNSA